MLFFFFSFCPLARRSACGGPAPLADDATLRVAEGVGGCVVWLLMWTAGAGESGKSTISKQMKIIHLNGFTEAELLGYKPILHSNAIESIKILVNACDELAVPIQGANAALADKFEVRCVCVCLFSPL